MAPVSSLFLISLFYTFSKIQETIWKSGKLEWRGQYFLFFPDVPDFLIHFSFKVLGFELGEGDRERFWVLSWEPWEQTIRPWIWMGATTSGRRDSEPGKRISNTQVQGTRGARAWWMVGLGYAHSHLSLTWTLDIPCWLLDILLMSFTYSVQHQQSWLAIATSFT